ncbi:MAG: MBL fold metallo-hydrolase [Candidatus Krumholzibacteria bacterium]|nr:MBL fold metallo-hydrolase [Candidatus Krumholzibacteria bacterium]
MIFHQIDAGGDRNFAYLMADEDGGRAALFDPPADSERYLSLVAKHGLTVDYIILTHGHADHTLGVDQARRQTQARVVAHPRNPVGADVRVVDGDTLVLGSLTLKFFYTPGHSDDSICVLGEDKLITGDTLFVGKVGGTDYGENARKEYDSLHQKLMILEDDIEVYPGHNFGVKPSSTIGHERNTNPFLLGKSFEDFVHLKKNWLQYKKEHGID